MAKSRREYFRKTRKTRLRELKHTKTGWCGMAAALLAAVLFLVSVIVSFASSGDAGVLAGSVSLIGLVLAAGALVLGIMAVREPKIRPIPPRTAIILGGILTVVLAGLYISGIV